jgi:hypothetical protein
MSQAIIADAANNPGLSAQGFSVAREVSRRAPELRPGGQQIPEHFSDSNDSKTHE